MKWLQAVLARLRTIWRGPEEVTCIRIQLSQVLDELAILHRQSAAIESRLESKAATVKNKPPRSKPASKPKAKRTAPEGDSQ